VWDYRGLQLPGQEEWPSAQWGIVLLTATRFRDAIASTRRWHQSDWRSAWTSQPGSDLRLLAGPMPTCCEPLPCQCPASPPFGEAMMSENPSSTAAPAMKSGSQAQLSIFPPDAVPSPFGLQRAEGALDRPFARGLLAQIMSMFRSISARLNCVMRSPPTAPCRRLFEVQAHFRGIDVAVPHSISEIWCWLIPVSLHVAAKSLQQGGRCSRCAGGPGSLDRGLLWRGVFQAVAAFGPMGAVSLHFLCDPANVCGMLRR
jgi:hypothetical protein